MNLSDCLNQSHYALEKRAARLGFGGLSKAWNWARGAFRATPAIRPGVAQGAAQGAARAPGATPVIPHGPAVTTLYPAPVPPSLPVTPSLPAGPNILSRGLKSKPAIAAYGLAAGGALTYPVAKTVSDLEADAWKVREAQSIGELAAGKALFESRKDFMSRLLSAFAPDKNYVQGMRDRGLGGVADAYEAEDKYRQSEAQYQRGQVSGAKHWNREEELYKRHGDKLDLSWASRAFMKHKYPNV